MRTKIAQAKPFAGAPKITVPGVFGASPEKPFLWRISVLGERPMTVSVRDLPETLTLEGQIVRGTAPAAGEYPVTVAAENAHGREEKTVLLRIAPDGMLRTPLLGFTTWNAYETEVTQEDVRFVAETMIRSGIAEYGYNYVNLDSSWQDAYGGPYDAIQPCSRFPDMKGMYDHLHALGLKGGIYATPFLHAWGCPKDREWIPGCTRGEADIRFPMIQGGIGTEHCEEQNVRQWTEWGVDYLKYDWRPTDPVNADLMKRALMRSEREIAFCVTVHANEMYEAYWRKNCCSWRNNDDTRDVWENILQRVKTLKFWVGKTDAGHFYDLDMLGIGAMVMNGGKCRFTEEEELTAYTLHAFFPSPIQLSMQLDKLSDFEKNLICNEEMIAINQDRNGAYPVEMAAPEGCRIYRRDLADGAQAFAIFNLTDEAVTGDVLLEKKSAIRSVWEKADCGTSDRISYALDPHESAVFVVR